MPNHYIFTLKMATAMSAGMLDNFHHLMLLIPKSRSCTLNSSHENLRTRIAFLLKILQITLYISIESSAFSTTILEIWVFKKQKHNHIPWSHAAAQMVLYNCILHLCSGWSLHYTVHHLHSCNLCSLLSLPLPVAM
jgi:hypothetical protein